MTSLSRSREKIGLLPLDFLKQEIKPIVFLGLPGQQLHWRVPLVFARLVPPMIVIKHDQVEQLLRDMISGGIQVGPNDGIQAFDQTGALDNLISCSVHLLRESVQGILVPG